MNPKLHGAIAAAVTPLRDGGTRLDEDGAASLVRFLADGGIDGVLTCGTTGEGVLLSVQERMRVTELALQARPRDFQVAVHAGAQTSAHTGALAAHAQVGGADAVAVIAPPYFPLDPEELFHHFLGAASACEPLPFYVYEFAGRSGYAIPPEVVIRLRQDAPNLAGMKVSDTPFEAVAQFLLAGRGVVIGSAPLGLEGRRNRAGGGVSGLATAWPEVVSELVHSRDPAAHARVVELRDGLSGIPFHAALKHVLAQRGVLLHEDVRPPLRSLTDQERAEVQSL